MKLKAKHILLKHEYEAKDVFRKLQEGVPFEKLAEDFSICPSGTSGGDLGEFRKGQMVPAFEAALLKLKENEISGIIKTSFGFHLIKRS